MSNAAFGENEYTNLDQRKKQQQSLSSPYVTPDVVYDPPKADATAGALSELTSLYAGELARLREDQAKQQAQLAAQQLALKNQRDAQINAAYNNSKANLGTARDDALTSAYIANMKGLKNMPQIAAAGGNGGYAQSLAAKHQLNYENNRNSVEQNYINNLRQLEADRNAGLTASAESYTTGLMGLQADSQNYLNSLNALQKDATGYAADMESLIKKLGNTVNTGGDKEVSDYKIGNKTYTRDEYINHLIGLGMSKEEAYNYMKNNKLL